jgi:hypothetical protein
LFLIRKPHTRPWVVPRTGIRVSDPFWDTTALDVFRPSSIPQVSMHPWDERSRFVESHIWRKVRAQIWGTHGPSVRENPQAS